MIVKKLYSFLHFFFLKAWQIYSNDLFDGHICRNVALLAILDHSTSINYLGGEYIIAYRMIFFKVADGIIHHFRSLDCSFTGAHYAKLSRVMRAPWVDRFLNNEIYCFPLSKKRCWPPLRPPPTRRPEGIVTLGRQQSNAGNICCNIYLFSRALSNHEVLLS